MLKRFYKPISLVIILSYFLSASASFDQCKSLLDYIYRELTLNSLELSYQRAMNKMLLGLHTVNKNTAKQKEFKPKLTKIFNALEKLDPKFKNKFSNNRSMQKKILWLFPYQSSDSLKNTELKNIFDEWIILQKNSPELFSGLEEKYKLDSWDAFTMNLLEQASNINFSNSTYKKQILLLGQNLKAKTLDVLNGKRFNEKSLKEQIKKTHQEILKTFKENAASIVDDYQNICDQDAIELYLENTNAVCPFPDNNISLDKLNLELASLQKTINETGLLSSHYPSDHPVIELVESPNILIHILDYKVNNSIKSTFCKRKPELMSMIVIHHTAMAKNTKITAINDSHIDNPENENDPWYMIGYNYIISETYRGATSAIPKVFQGRPPEIQGAHTGGKNIKLTSEQRKYMKNEIVSCGNKMIGFTSKNILEKAKNEDGIKGNLMAYGIAINGNYQYVENIVGNTKITNGIDPGVPSIPSDEVILTVAKLACDLQRKNPRVKTIVPHSYFKKTFCPGRWIESLNKIKSKALKLGCDFTVVLTKDKHDD